MNLRAVIATVAALPLCGCATLSFAPPAVDMTKRMQVSGTDVCTFAEGTAFSSARSVERTISMVDNYIAAYRCAMFQAADGRQAFEVPSFLAALTGIAAPAFGAGPDVALGAGIGAATFNSANSYWVPTEKAGLVDSALDALLCVKTEMVGVKFIDTTKTVEGSPEEINTNNDKQTAVYVDAQQQYDALVTASLGQIERILASRLRSVGEPDPAGLIAQIQQLTEKRNEALKDDPAGTQSGDEAEDPETENGETETSTGNARDPEQMDEGETGGNTGIRVASNSKPKASKAADRMALRIASLEPRMQLCVLRAKM